MALKKIGGLWKPDAGRNSKAVLTGKLDDGRKVFVFPNDKGDNPKRPDYNLTVQEPDQPADETAYAPQQPADDPESFPF
jgi:hypothetical protein